MDVLDDGNSFERMCEQFSRLFSRFTDVSGRNIQIAR